MELHDKPQRFAMVYARRQQDGYGLFNTETARFYILNEIGYAVWERCTGSNTVQQIAQALFEILLDPPELNVVEKDVVEILDQMHQNGLVSVA